MNRLLFQQLQNTIFPLLEIAESIILDTLIKKTGEISSEKKDGFERGRLARYALNFQIYNDSAAKGLKGIELPSGNANFDIALDAELTEFQ